MKILRYFTVSLALVMLLVTSCTKEEIEVAPEVSLEPVASEMTSVTFRITSENAVDAAYIRLKDLTQVPSARAILAGGEKVPVPGQDVVLSGLTPGETYYMAAAAVSEGEVYSEVKTLEMSIRADYIQHHSGVHTVLGSSFQRNDQVLCLGPRSFRVRGSR